MRCPFCKEIIEDDSLFCDQCGKELMFCPDCRAPKRGTDCPVCGATLVSGKLYFAPKTAIPKAPAVQSAPETDVMPKRLVGSAMQLELKPGVFGRTGGIYPELSSCIFVSGRHGELALTPDGWTVTDLGSTNGTYINGKRLKPHAPYPLMTGDSLKISLKLEFTVQ